MKSLVTAILAGTLVACTQVTPQPSLPVVSQKKTAAISWETDKLVNGNDNLSLNVNGRSYFLKHVSNSRVQTKSDFVNLGVPATASTAIIYWVPKASEEDGSKMYAQVEGSNVVIYDGWIGPGEMHNVEWKKYKTIPF